MIQYDTTAVKGDTIRITQYIKNSDGYAFGYTGCTLYMNVRSSLMNGSVIAQYSKYIPEYPVVIKPDGFSGGICSEASGTLYICLGSTYSNLLKPDNTATYEVKIKSPTNNDIVTLMYGNIYPFSQVTTNYSPSPQKNYVVSSSLYDYETSDSVLNIILPSIIAAGIKPALWLYNGNYVNDLGTGGTQNKFNPTSYSYHLNAELALWSAKNNTFSSFGAAPEYIVTDFESSITEYINDWKSTGITMMNELIDVYNKTKQLSPTSKVLQYNTPLIPYYPDQSMRSYGGSGYTYSAALQQFTNKVNYLRAYPYSFDLSFYCPFYENPNDYNDGSGPIKIADYAYNMQLQSNTLNAIVNDSMVKQVSMSFVLYTGLDSDIPTPSGPNAANQAAALGKLVFSNDFINTYVFVPAKASGFTHLTIWEGWKNRIDTIQLQGANVTADTYLQRKVMNDLFKDLNPGDNGYGLTADSQWIGTNPTNKMWTSVTAKTIQLANLFKGS